MNEKYPLTFWDIKRDGTECATRGSKYKLVNNVLYVNDGRGWFNSEKHINVILKKEFRELPESKPKGHIELMENVDGLGMATWLKKVEDKVTELIHAHNKKLEG